MPQRLAILASGSGSNAEAIVAHFRGPAREADVEVVGILTDRAAAGVLDRAARLGTPARHLDAAARTAPGGLLGALEALAPDLVVLAGYLRLVPADVVAAFPGRIVNLHPALLPRHGGAGMYGAHVHAAVRDAGDARTGITVHLVDERYDEGRALFQASCPVAPGQDAGEIARDVRRLEHRHFPPVLRAYLRKLPPRQRTVA